MFGKILARFCDEVKVYLDVFEQIKRTPSAVLLL